MDDEEFDFDDISRRMQGAIVALKTEFSGLRTGRANVGLLDSVMVEAYGASMPLNQVATVSVPEPRSLSVQVWDKGQTAAVEKAIRNSGLGLNPMTEGQLVRIPIPELNEERRQEIARVAAKYSEAARVAVRNVRRDGMDKLKHLEKDSAMSQDEHKLWSDEVQSETDKTIQEIDQAFANKEKEITQI
ncbi:MAG: ribosome recycling factor [Alphaproteobacteria bacterium]